MVPRVDLRARKMARYAPWSLRFSQKKGIGSLAHGWIDGGLGGFDRPDPPAPLNPWSIKAIKRDRFSFMARTDRP